MTSFGFQSGAKIEVNGQTQKTANDAINPSTLLIAKQAGKFIASGTTVQLAVLNPNGTRSAPLSFTRS
ncbi:MAG: hypothetical protein HY231_01200 [Acidobacteria bacterium]|nr:hypothetical protein [Acidobacteriota bacterium]